VGKASAVLIRSYIRIMIQHRLKHVSVTPEEAAEQQAQDEQQPYLPEMEEFRNIPESVSIRLPVGRCIYVPYAATLEADRINALGVLAMSIEADQRKYHAMKSGNEFASALVKIYGDLPLAELVKRWKADGARKVRR
jgi:hypothetical protein